MCSKQSLHTIKPIRSCKKFDLCQQQSLHAFKLTQSYKWFNLSHQLSSASNLTCIQCQVLMSPIKKKLSLACDLNFVSSRALQVIWFVSATESSSNPSNQQSLASAQFTFECFHQQQKYDLSKFGFNLKNKVSSAMKVSPSWKIT